MKIVIGINSFKKEEELNHRERMCVDSLYELQKRFKDIVKLVNVTFTDEKHISLKDFYNYHCLKQIPINITNKKIPFVNEIFDNLACINSDYFIFVNNDILVTERYIIEILEHPDIESFPASKLHFTKLNSIDDQDKVPESLSVHGFDGFAIKNTWWIQNRKKFKPMLLSRAYWDTYFFAKCRLYSKCLTLNKPPAVIYHLDHKSTSMEEDVGNTYNQQIFMQDYDNISLRWFSYVQDVLLKRSTQNDILWYTPGKDEEILEQKYFTL